MSRSGPSIPGFCYVTQKAVAMTADSWRRAYPPDQFRRVVENGETFYHKVGGKLVAEAYGNIPAKRVQT
jgi:hypothetical protein